MASWLVVVAALVAFAGLVVYLMDQVYLDVSGRYVFVTGCDSGFGNILAKYLGRKRGCHVIAGCLTQAGVDNLMSCAPKGTVTAIQIDVTNTESILRARDTVTKIVAGKGLWGLINNAGVPGNPVPYHWLKKREMQHILDVNLMGTVEVTNIFFPLLRQAQGRIINLSSATAVFPIRAGAYSMSKIGVDAFSDIMRVSSKAFGVTVHILEPGYFRTNVTSVDTIIPAIESAWNRLPQQEKDIYGQQYIDTLKEKAKLILDTSSPALHLVTNAMEHALCARWPWRRYLPGKDIKFLYKPLSMLPAWLADFLVCKLAEIPVAQPKPTAVVTYAADNNHGDL
ncbi:retinol dehydrogenase 3-like [Acanthaster planci]|uniref:Retinol dehydrogenase 3-like n=1 Tax=Acanthaster planci TaxID=133434 RepID=A0A8B7XXC0_ACAPL|nr:retinol dehydrogenase 3-like [Acanthaster planci]